MHALGVVGNKILRAAPVLRIRTSPRSRVTALDLYYFDRASCLDTHLVRSVFGSGTTPVTFATSQICYRRIKSDAVVVVRPSFPVVYDLSDSSYFDLLVTFDNRTGQWRYRFQVVTDEVVKLILFLFEFD